MSGRSPAQDDGITLMLLGSGMRFSAFIGALSAVEEKGIKVKRIVGASAGSIIGCAYACGKSPLEMKKIAHDVDILSFKDFSVRSLVAGKGLYAGDALERWTDDMVAGKRFGDDFRITPYVIATDVMNNTPFVFSRANFPDLKISQAIRFSVGIPWVFAYRKFRSNGNSHVFIDGNFMSGIIEEMFDMFNKYGKTLVIRTVSRRSRSGFGRTDLTLGSYIRNLSHIMMNSVERERVEGDRWKDTILVFCGDIQSTKFSISQEERGHLFEAGYAQVKKYLEYKWGI